MKKLFIASLVVLSATFTVEAQKKSGAIQFETMMDPAAMASGSGIQLSEEMKARMPKSVKMNFELLFTATNASYMVVEETEDSNGGGGGGMGRMMMRFGGGGASRENYYAFADKKLSEVFEMNDTTFIMPAKLSLTTSGPVGSSMNAGAGGRNTNSAVQNVNEPPVVEVVKSDETKNILGFNCHKVTIKSTRKVKILDMEREVTEETVLWYTNDLGFDFSPNINMWTEGAVLAIEGRGNNTVAKSIEYRNVSSRDVTPPKKGVAITADEYQAKMENMRRNMRNNNNGSRGGQSGVRNIVIN